MNDTPPRRSRRSTPPQQTSLPFVPIFIGIIVLGFIIGAGLSLAGKRGGGDHSVVANVAPTRSAAPARARTLPPVTPAPTGAPTPTDAPPTETATSKPSAAPPSAAPAPSASATHAPAKHAAATHAPITPVPAAAPPATAAAASAAPVTPKATSIAGQAAKPTGRPHIAAIPVAAPPAMTPIAKQVDAKADAPASGDDADSEFAKLAATVVRQYVTAIERGDDATAYAAFGPGAAGNVKLLESGTLDGSTRIQHVEARGAGSNATVNVDLKTAKGLYFGQYTVHRTESGAALITDHALNRL